RCPTAEPPLRPDCDKERSPVTVRGPRRRVAGPRRTHGRRADRRPDARSSSPSRRRARRRPPPGGLPPRPRFASWDAPVGGLLVVERSVLGDETPRGGDPPVERQRLGSVAEQILRLALAKQTARLQLRRNAGGVRAGEPIERRLRSAGP